MGSWDYQCGVIDAFNEIVRAGVKKLALSHPVATQKEAEQLIPFVEQITAHYQTKWKLEKELLITDLFPYSANQGKIVFLFYEDPVVFETYLTLKQRKQALLEKNAYTGSKRREIACCFGRLLSYSEEAIARLIDENSEKEDEL